MHLSYTCPDCFHKAPRGRFPWLNPNEVECPECGEVFGTRFIDQVQDHIATWRVKYHLWISMRQIRAGKVLSYDEWKIRMEARQEERANPHGTRLTTFLLLVAGAIVLLLLLVPIPLLIPMLIPIGGMP